MTLDRVTVWLLAWIPFTVVCANAAEPRCDVDYRLEARWDATPRHFEVTLSYELGKATSARLISPKSWASVNDYDKTITDLRSLSPDVALTSTGDQLWTLSASKPMTRVSVRYKLLNGFAGIDGNGPISQPDFYRNTLARNHFQLIGNGALVVPENLADFAGAVTCVRFTGLPSTWNFASSFSAGQRNGEAVFQARGLSRQIQHAVFVGGNFRVLERRVEGKPLFVALRGELTFTDAAFADTTAALIGAHRRFWDDNDFAHYLIMLAPNRAERSYGGTGLNNAFTMHAAKDFAVPGPQFDFLIGHEHLHTWIPERLGAMGTDEARRYWLSEGFTNYLTHRLLLRSGVWSAAQYSDALNRVVAAYRMSPVIGISNEQLAREFFNRPDESGQLAYQRGELLAIRWANRLAAKGQSMDAVLRSLKRDRASSVERSSDRPELSVVRRLADALRPALGNEVDADIGRFIEQGEVISVDGGFLGPCFDARLEQRSHFELGFDAQQSFSARKVMGVTPGSRADKAGLRDGMVIRAGSFQHGDISKEVMLTVLDGDAERTIRYLPASEKTVAVPVFSVRSAADPAPDCARWLADARS